MALPVEYHPAAEDDLTKAVDYYANRAPGLGAAFHSEVKRAEGLATRHPEGGSPFAGEVRRWLIHRFPYALVYAAEPQRIYVLAIAHLRRQPEFWVDGH